MPPNVCKVFINVPKFSYKPLVCKTDVIETRDIKFTGKANKADFFFLTKPNTIRERATLDLLYPTPNFLKFALQRGAGSFQRVTVSGFTRLTTDNFIRVTAAEP